MELNMVWNRVKVPLAHPTNPPHHSKGSPPPQEVHSLPHIQQFYQDYTPWLLSKPSPLFYFSPDFPLLI